MALDSFWIGNLAMISVSGLSLQYLGGRKLFDSVDIKFTPGNCYGVIGANGAGKSSLIKILSGEIEPTAGSVNLAPDLSLSVLKQDHFQFDGVQVLETVILGHKELVQIMKDKDALYAKEDFSDADGVVAAELERRFSELDGWEAEARAASLLTGIGLPQELHTKQMSELKDDQKVKVLLAQALFGKPDVLLLDEPTNHLDAKAILWLENFLLDFDNTVIVVSHDRHFMNRVCSHMVDIDYGKIKLFVGNYDFWDESSQLAARLAGNENKKKEEKSKELEAFIRRFSANASKSRQATSRRKQLEKLTIDDIPISTRKRPYVNFEQDREAGDILLEVKNLSKSIGGELLLDNVSFELAKGDKVIFVGAGEVSKTTLFEILAGNMEADSGQVRWGVTTTRSYLPKDQNSFFDGTDLSLIDWLRQYSEDQSESFIRSFLGRMLFSGDETLKKSSVLSGGEKVRSLLAKMMLKKANVLMLDGPTNHLDLESITAVNRALTVFPGTILFSTHDHEFAQTVATKLMDFSPKGKVKVLEGTYDQYVYGEIK
jgi:ATPase subunit of ABC transporter with duplicated ATPase domains